jgi:uncharacterized protein (TIGR03437 family)
MVRAWGLALFLLFASASQAAISQLICISAGAQALVRQEGLTEPLGDLALECEGDIPGGDVSLGLAVSLSATVTNRVATADRALGPLLEIHVGPDVFVQTANTTLSRPNTLVFDVVNVTLTSSARADIRITGLRVDATGETDQPVTAFVTSYGTSRISVTPNPVTIGLVKPGLLANMSAASIFCVGSPAPGGGEPPLLTELFAAGTVFTTLRVTEGQAEAFQELTQDADSGTRIVVRLSGFPEDARVFVPDVIAGSTAIQQTSAGDLGVPRSGGLYQATALGALLLSRVQGADENGAGGSLLYPPSVFGTGPQILNSAFEIPFLEGEAVLVYEVIDANPGLLESAHIPIFVALPSNSGAVGTRASARLSFGPVSTVAGASFTAPIPRFEESEPGLDCSVLQDCNATYFPRLSVDVTGEIVFAAQLGVPSFRSKRINVDNLSGGLMLWSAEIQYADGEAWLRATPAAGINKRSILLEGFADKTPGVGVHEATLTIDAGPVAGARVLPVKFVVTAGPAPDTSPVIGGVYNGASEAVKTLTPGSRGWLRGIRFDGATAEVRFDGFPAEVLSQTADRIQVIVPAGLGFNASAQAVLTVDGQSSEPFEVTLAPAQPAIYEGGVFNQDWTTNALSNGAAPNTVLQIFAAGLPLENLGRITARIHDVDVEQPAYAGPAPGIPGVQQVNLLVPYYFPTMTSSVLVCGWPANAPGTKVCSLPVPVTFRAE